VEFNLKTEMMLKIKHQKFYLNLKISLNKLLIWKKLENQLI